MKVSVEYYLVHDLRYDIRSIYKRKKHSKYIKQIWISFEDDSSVLIDDIGSSYLMEKFLDFYTGDNPTYHDIDVMELTEAEAFLEMV